MTEEDKNDRLSPLYIGPEKLLSLFSESDWSQFCLSYLLTDRDYSGVLGLAWEGKAGESHHDAWIKATYHVQDNHTNTHTHQCKSEELILFDLSSNVPITFHRDNEIDLVKSSNVKVKCD